MCLKQLDMGREDSRDLQGENQLQLVTDRMRQSRVDAVPRLLAGWLMLFSAFTFQVLACASLELVPDSLMYV